MIFFLCSIQYVLQRQQASLSPFKRHQNRSAYGGEMENATEGMRNWEEKPGW